MFETIRQCRRSESASTPTPGNLSFLVSKDQIPLRSDLDPPGCGRPSHLRRAGSGVLEVTRSSSTHRGNETPPKTQSEPKSTATAIRRDQPSGGPAKPRDFRAGQPTVNHHLKALLRLPTHAQIGLLRVYKVVLSPLFSMLGTNCRFHPTCSVYAIHALEKHGLIAGNLKIIGRLLRCAPWGTGGEDYP